MNGLFKKRGKNRHYTLMVIPEESSKVKKWFISDSHLRSLVFVAGFLILVGLVTSAFTLRYISKRQSFSDAQLKIHYLEGKLQQLQNKLTSSEATLTRLQNFEQKLRVIARVDQSSDETAIGPLSEEEEKLFLNGQNTGFTESGENNSPLAAKYEYSLRSMELSAEGMERKAMLQEQSLQHLYELLRDQKSMLSSTPSVWPVRGFVSSHFGYRISPFTGLRQAHHGIDIAAPTGSQVLSPADGVVSRASTVSGYGKLVAIKHGYGIVTRYGHNSKILVKVGQRIKRGEPISLVGSTGRSTNPHLHYEVMLNGVHVNPVRYILD